MDILNFISWIRGGRQVTTVDPAKTLLPVGLKDPKRDDGYLAGAISVADFAAQVGGLQTVSVDGVTITGDGTSGNPLVAVPSGSTYKVYTALLTQSGTSDPVATVLENTTGLTLTWGRSIAGTYSSSLFSTSLVVTVIVGNTFENIVTSYNISNAGASNYIGIVTKDVTGVLTDSKLNKTFIEIRVYS
jgi:hypothetical protein